MRLIQVIKRVHYFTFQKTNSPNGFGGSDYYDRELLQSNGGHEKELKIQNLPLTRNPVPFSRLRFPIVTIPAYFGNLPAQCVEIVSFQRRKRRNCPHALARLTTSHSACFRLRAAPERRFGATAATRAGTSHPLWPRGYGGRSAMSLHFHGPIGQSLACGNRLDNNR